MIIVDGKHIAKMLEIKLKEQFSQQPQKKVCFVLFGNDPASIQFINLKSRVAERLGVDVAIKKYPETISQEEAVHILGQIINESYDGIVIQLPLPKQLDSHTLLGDIPENKDIDGLGKALHNAPVAQAVFEIFATHGIHLENKNVLVIGNGVLVGNPIHRELLRRGIKHEIIDKDTNKAVTLEKMQSADVIISGVGISGLIKPHMIKTGVVLIDAGTSEQSGEIVGDVDPACFKKASLATPVPGGVGPITVMKLFANLL